MSELVLFVSCLTRQNIVFDVEEGEKFIFISVERGYAGFVTTLTFDKNGNFVDIGSWE